MQVEMTTFQAIQLISLLELIKTVQMTPKDFLARPALLEAVVAQNGPLSKLLEKLHPLVDAEVNQAYANAVAVAEEVSQTHEKAMKKNGWNAIPTPKLDGGDRQPLP